MGKRVTVLGAGNGGHALSLHLTMRGCEVTLFEHPNFAKNLEGIKERGGIEAIDKMTRGDIEIAAKMSGFAKIAATTTNIKEAIEYSDVVLIIVPSFAQETMFRLALPHLRDGQIMVLLPGNFGSLLCKKILTETGSEKRMIFAETNTIPHACRIVGPGQVFILGVKEALNIAALPDAETEKVREALKDVIPQKLIPLTNVLESGLSNANMVAHVPTAVLNMGLAESRQGEFYFYKEGMSESVSKVLQKVDDERVAVGKGLLYVVSGSETIKAGK